MELGRSKWGNRGMDNREYTAHRKRTTKGKRNEGIPEESDKRRASRHPG